MNIGRKDPRRARGSDDGGSDLETCLQSAAERSDAARGPVADGAHGATIDRYRFIYHAVRCAAMPEPPATFALRMESLTRDYAEEAGVEAWLLWLVAATAVAIVAVFGVPATMASMPAFPEAFAALPWRLLLALGAGLGTAGLADRLLSPQAR